MIINGIRQKYVKGEGFFVYRQKDPVSFFKYFGVKSIETEQNMTNDGILIFNNNKDRDEAINILKDISLKSNKKKIFYVEVLDQKRIFYQFDIKNKVNHDEIILLKDKSFKFFDLIECICERMVLYTKRRYFYKGFKLPDKIYNHEIYEILSGSLLDRA